MLKAFLLCVVLQYAAALYDCPKRGPVDTACPVSENVNGLKTCFAMISAKFGGAFTSISADEECKLKFGRGCFQDLRCYLIEETDIRGSLDKKVLIGMTYDPDTKTTRLYDGEIQSPSYWGEKSIPLTYGTTMVLRAHETYDRSKLVNFGAKKDTRFDRFMCEFPHGK